MKIMKKYIVSALTGLLMVSCVDTSVLPDDKITGDDFWQSKEDVSNMVADVYKAMCNVDAMERYIVWGNFRSDELIETTTNINDTKHNALKDISNGVMTTTNTYANWASIYSIINRCNVILEKAPNVVLIDPSYTQETYNTDESQMLGIRALCHFYLLRAFRDVPYSESAYLNSSQDMAIAQNPPSVVLQKCIDDLNRALAHPLSPTGYTDWRKVGLLNRDGLKAILADVYLWRASMMHNDADYSECARLCQEIIDSKKSQVASSEQGGSFGPGMGGGNISPDQDYPLYDGEYAFARNFISGNSSESIFEIQLDGINNSNSGLRNMYWNYDDKSRSTGYVKVPRSLFGTADDNSTYSSEKDYRYYDNCFDVGGNDLENINVRKMVALTGTGNSSNNVGSWKSDKFAPRGYSQINQNWIFYRLTDIMLMKAEALVQMGDDASLTEAFELVAAVYNRSQGDAAELTEPTLKNKEEYEKLVLNERRRELCFEGKRWFDLLRYNYRHLEGVRPDLMLWQIAGDGGTKESFLQNYSEMMNIVALRYSEGGSSTVLKINREAFLYFPVLESEMKVNANLHQNPVYSSNDIYQKN
ncbi:MAG: RagB/SusD family nutrient uptake outer membrane protein [Prevotella sp.]